MRVRHQQPSHLTKDEFGVFDRDTESVGEQEEGNSFNFTGSRGNSSTSSAAQLKDKDLTIMNGKEKIARRSNIHDRPKELILSPNAYQQQMDFEEGGSSHRVRRQTMEDVRMAECEKVCSDHTGDTLQSSVRLRNRL